MNFLCGVHLCGFLFAQQSRSEDGISEDAEELKDDVGKIALLGFAASDDLMWNDLPLIKKHHERVYEIMGARDFWGPDASNLPPNQQATIDGGHLDLPFLSTTHQKIVEWFS